MNLKKYISELKRRRVIKASLAYLIVAWVIAEVASVVLPTFNAPAYFMKGLLFLLAIGFPINLVFAWIYDITPEGIKKTEDIDHKAQKSIQKNSRINKVIIASLAIVVVLLLINQFWNKAGNKEEKVESSEIMESADADKKSIDRIAVLPFSNIRSDPETDYLGFAIADQIIGSLVYFQNITVRPSSSIRKYEKLEIDPKAAGDNLKVDYVLVGNYLKEANIIRLNVELVDVYSNEIIWHEPIQVDFNSAFELQDIVVQKVVEGLNIQFSQEELNRIEKDIPANPLAYEYYLRGLSFPLTIEGNQLATEMLKRSIELDSNYAPAYSQLADRVHRVALFGYFDSEKYKKVEEIYKKAISLNKDLISAQAGLAMYYVETARINDAVEISNYLLGINPNNADALFSLGYSYRYAGMVQESIIKMEEAIKNDPRNPSFRSLSLSYHNIGDYEKAFKVFENLESSHWAIGMKGFLFFSQGKNEQALEIFNQIINKEPDSFWGLISTTYRAIIQGDTLTGLQTMKKREKLNIKDAEPLYYQACDYALLGDKDGCLRSLQKAVDGGYFNYPFMLTDSFLDSMRGKPKFEKILEEAKEKHEAFKKRFF